MTCAGENWNRFWLSLSHTHETILISEPDECLIWQMSEPIWSSWLRIYERGTKSVQLGKIFDRQFLPLMMSSSGSRETMVKLLARPAKLGGNSTYLLIKLEPPIFNSTLPTCRWGVCRRRGRCPRHQSSKVLADRLTRRHSNTPVLNHSDKTKDEHLECQWCRGEDQVCRTYQLVLGLLGLDEPGLRTGNLPISCWSHLTVASRLGNKQSW